MSLSLSLLALLRDFMSEANKQHANTTAVLEEMKQGINDIKTRVAVIETNLASVLQIEKGVTTVGGSVEEVKVSISRANEELVNAVDDLNNRMRRNNLIIKGLSEEEKEDYTSTERIVREFFATKLETTLEPNDIERAHRVGQPRPDFTRPIIVKFLNFKTKSDALRNGPKLKDLEPNNGSKRISRKKFIWNGKNCGTLPRATVEIMSVIISALTSFSCMV